MDQTPRKGLLGRARFGASMPVDAPYYQHPPFYYRDARALSVTYDTDADAAAAMLPEGLELPLPARATLIVVQYPHSTLGPYNEAMLGLRCTLQGHEYFYIPLIVVDSVPPLVAGREIWGYPKKLAKIELRQEQELWVGNVERPSGVRLLSVAMRPEQPAKPPPAPASTSGGGSLSLRLIPSAEEGQAASAELIAVSGGERQTHEIWVGPGSLSFEAAGTLDAWHQLPVRRMLSASLSRYDFSLPRGRTVHRY